MENVADYHIPTLDRIREAGGAMPAIGGIDWALRVDQNAIVCLSPLQDHGANEERLGGPGLRPMFISHLAARTGWAWHDFTAHIATVSGAFEMRMLASEVNGVGDAATSMLRMALQQRGLARVPVGEVWTDMRRKQAGFGRLKALLQRGVLILPRDPEVLREIRGLEYEQTQAGGVRISVPENRGHDDIAMALMQAVSCLSEPESWWSRDSAGWQDTNIRRVHELRRSQLEWCETTAGLRAPVHPLPDPGVRNWVFYPRGME